MDGVVLLGFCVLAVPIGLGIVIGWMIRGRGARSETATAHADHATWLAGQLDEEPFRSVLDPDQRRHILDHYSQAAHILPVQFPPASPVARSGAEPAPGPIPAAPSHEAPVPAAGRVAVSAPHPDGRFAASPLAAPAPPVRPRREWDPAVLMLYLGAFLVVAAGLVYASYNWADLGSWQKLGMLAMVTIAFAGAGFGLLPNERMRQAAETFVAIGALLVPANALAAGTVLHGTDAPPALIVLLGALATALVYLVFSLRPGGVIYSYGAVLAGMLAIAAVVPVFGVHPGWSAVPVLLTIAIIPDLIDRLGNRWDHLGQPLRRCGIAILPLAIFVGVGSFPGTSDWIVPVTLAAATIALGRIAHGTGSTIAAVACSLTAIATVLGVPFAFHIESVATWALLTSGVALALIAIGERGTPWMRRPRMRMVLHIEALIGFYVASAIAAAGPAWLFTGSLAIGALGATLIALLRNTRWWLLAAGLFVTGVWFSLPDLLGTTAFDERGTMLFAIPLPLLLAGAAFGLDRWSTRSARDSSRWGEPLWAIAAIDAVIVTALPLFWWFDGKSFMFGTLALASALFGATAFLAALSIDRPRLRIIYGIWAIISICSLAAMPSLNSPDRVALILVLTTLVACLSLPAPRAPLHRLARIRQPGSPTTLGSELAVFAVVIAATLLTMLGFTATYIVAPSDTWTGAVPGFRWTWLCQLAIFPGITTVATGIGFRLGRRPDKTSTRLTRYLPDVALFFGFVTAALAMRTVTTDWLTWTWAGTALAALLIAISHLAAPRAGTNPFLRQLARRGRERGLGLGAVALLANLSLAFDSGHKVNDTIQVAMYLVIGLGAIGLGPRFGTWLATGVGFAALALADIFLLRALGAGSTTTLYTLLVLAWVTVGTSFLLARTTAWKDQQPAWLLSALGIGGAVTLWAFSEANRAPIDSPSWQTVIISLVSLAGLLAVDAAVRQDRRRGIVASMLAMLALLLEVAAGKPGNLQAYAVPLGLYLLALGYVQRRDPGSRDILLGMGSAALLGPALLQALQEERFAYLLLAGGEALVLFLGGALLRLRVPIAAGVIAITLIALRIMVDAVSALPGWITLLAVGLVLLGGGTILLTWKEALGQRLERVQRGWHDMG